MKGFPGQTLTGRKPTAKNVLHKTGWMSKMNDKNDPLRFLFQNLELKAYHSAYMLSSVFRINYFIFVIFSSENY